MDLEGVVWRMEAVCSPDKFFALLDDQSAIPSSSETNIPFTSEKPLRGIVAHLSQLCGGHVVDRNIVVITSTPPYQANQVLSSSHLADLDTADKWFSSEDVENAWFCFDFKELRIIPTHYTIQSWEGGAGELLSWKVEGSEDGTEWTLLDRHSNSRALCGRGQIASFEIKNSLVLRMIRLTQTGKSNDGDNQLCCSAFEVFGTIRGLHKAFPGISERKKTQNPRRSPRRT
jgi:hypothetical protein